MKELLDLLEKAGVVTTLVCAIESEEYSIEVFEGPDGNYEVEVSRYDRDTDQVIFSHSVSLDCPEDVVNYIQSLD